MMPAPVIHQVSKSVIRPSSPPPERRRSIHLTPLDLRFLSIQYIQKGILLPNPQQPPSTVINLLISSLSVALNYFYPLAGRLSTTHHPTSPHSLSVVIDCNDEGAEFTHATAAHLTSSDLLTPLLIPHILYSLFPLNEALCLHGHSLPLLAVQTTELADGTIFLACSLNHAVADGTSFWHFFNSWSAISRIGTPVVVAAPILNRGLLPFSPPPILLPFPDLESQINKYTPQELLVRVFHFSSRIIGNLKSEANTCVKSNGVGSRIISSLQALLAHVWICVVRARKFPANQQTRCGITIGCRDRLEPQLPAAYFGNCIMSSMASASAGELVNNGLSWAASSLKELVEQQTASEISRKVELWVKEPVFSSLEGLKPSDLLMGSSPRFDVYGNDFGWGRPMAVREGGENKYDGKVTAFPGPDDGSVALEICLCPNAMSYLVEDDKFMHA